MPNFKVLLIESQARSQFSEKLVNDWLYKDRWRCSQLSSSSGFAPRDLTL